MSDRSSVLIRRKKIFANKENEEKKQEQKIEESEENSKDEESGLNPKYVQATAILFFVVALAIFVSLVSYTVQDESNAKISLSYLSELFEDTEGLKFRAENTQNWLGLAGAIVSYHLYNSSLGIIILLLPYFMTLISIDLFKEQNVQEKTLKSILTYLIFAFLFSSLMGTLSLTDVFGNMPKELSGAIGFYMGDLTSSIIGVFGSFLIFSTSLLLTIVLGTRFKLEPVIDFVGRSASDIKPEIGSFWENLKVELPKREKKTKKKKKKEDNADIEEIEEDSIQDEIEEIDEVKVEDKQTEKIQEEPKPIPKSFGFKPLKISLNTKKEETSFEDSYDEDEEVHDNEVNDIEPVLSNNDPIIQDIIEEEDEIENNVNSDSSNSVSNQISSLMADLDCDEDELEQKTVQITKKTIKPEAIENVHEIVEKKPEKPKLVLDVEEFDYSEDEGPGSPLSTLIHDEQISFKNPHGGLLTPPVKAEGVDNDELEMNARILQEKLETFKIHIENLEITPGPVVTQYAFQPAAGIKISRIESLSDDLAMALRAKGIRIIAPIPGKGSVGIEIPNNNPSLVTFSSVINSKKFDEKKMHLPVALGKTISGETSVTDLAKMPHLLVAGSTGSGKSVGVNTIINSLLYKKSPEDLKFVIIDPKKVELQQYKALKSHYLAVSPDIRSDIVTDPIEAVALLKSTVLEMENRYDILAKVGQRNIADYNEKVQQGKYKDDPEMEHRKMPYIVVIVDEFADLMLTASKEIEEPIVRLAQMARAVGIHLVLATQRPSVDVITGIIKANFPARIAYLVASKIDSRTILDTGGAEQLLGMGDMLFLPSGKPKPERIQNAFISTDEVEAVCEYIGNQKGYTTPYILPSIHEKAESEGMIAASDRDPLFRDAASLVISTQQGSVSLIQRRLKVGYARAGRIMDELEDSGIVGPFEGSKARQVYLESEAELESII